MFAIDEGADDQSDLRLSKRVFTLTGFQEKAPLITPPTTL
jgi:hypothetical protein